MIDWIDERCREWGRQAQNIYLGSNGWPSQTLMHKLIAEAWIGSKSRLIRQFSPEVFTGEGLRTNLAIKCLDETSRETLFIHYVIRKKATQKARILRINRTAYYLELDRVHKKLSGFLNSSHDRHNSSFLSDTLRASL